VPRARHADALNIVYSWCLFPIDALKENVILLYNIGTSISRSTNCFSSASDVYFTQNTRNETVRVSLIADNLRRAIDFFNGFFTFLSI
jgi:hypothetical protein